MISGGYTRILARILMVLAVAALIPACSRSSSGRRLVGGAVVTAPPGGGGTSGTPGPTASAWQNPLPAGHALHDMAGYDPDSGTADDEAIWAVGDFGVIRHSDDGGQTWTTLPSGTTENLYGIALLDATPGSEVLVAVGANGTILLLTAGGDTVDSPDPADVPADAAGITFNDVAFANASVGWIVGDMDPDTGTSWILKTADAGLTWADQSLASMGDVTAVTATSTTQAWAATSWSRVLRTVDGNAWSWTASTIDGPARGIVAYDPSAAANDELVVAVAGYYYTRWTNGAFDDSTRSWNYMGDPLNAVVLADPLTTALTDDVLYIAGDDGVLFRSTDGGQNWTSVDSGETNRLLALLATGADLVWAAGPGMQTLGTRNGTAVTPTVEDLLNSTAATRAPLRAVDAASGSTAWAVGAGGVILRTTNGGTVWAPQTSGTTRALNAVRFADASKGWTVGDQGTIRATVNAGTSWTGQTSGVTRRLNGVDFVDGVTGWVVGNNGTILHTSDGTAWTDQTSAATNNHLNAVDFVDASRGWAVGRTGVIVATADGGVTWAEQDSQTNRELNGVSFTGTQKGWAVGANGTILVTSDGGATWNPQTSGVADALLAVRFTDDFHGVVVGDSGVILTTTDGGATWEPLAATVNDLSGVDMASNTDGWVVGADGTILKLNP